MLSNSPYKSLYGVFEVTVVERLRKVENPCSIATYFVLINVVSSNPLSDPHW